MWSAISIYISTISWAAIIASILFILFLVSEYKQKQLQAKEKSKSKLIIILFAYFVVLFLINIL